MKEKLAAAFKWRRLIAVLVGIAVLVSGFFIHALAGLAAQDVVYAKPPGFVAHYAQKHASQSTAVVTDKVNAALTPVTQNHARETALAREVFFADGGGTVDSTADALIALFSHPDKAQRVKAALAFSA